MRRDLLQCALCLFWAACSAPAAEAPADLSADAPVVCSVDASLAVVAVDPWGGALADAAWLVDGGSAAERPCAGGGPPGDFCLAPGSYKLELTAPGFEGLQWSVEAEAGTLPQLTTDSSADWYRADGTWFDGEGCGHRVLFLAPAHRYFASSGRTPLPNLVSFFHAGELLYGALANDLAKATRSVCAATWWWQSNFELTRPLDDHLVLTPEERWQNTAMGMLEGLNEVRIRVLVGRFAEETATGMAYVNTDTALREKAYDTNDLFEVMLQGNPTPVPLFESYQPSPHKVPLAERIPSAYPEFAEVSFAGTGTAALSLSELEAASWHQKCWVVDGEVAYISGMNVKSTDWDTPEHAVFEARRMKYQSTTAEREAVAAHELLPDLGPRKDAGVRLAGPAAAQVEALLARRWAWGRERGDLFAKYTTPWEAPDVPDDRLATGIPVQVVATMPEPFGERSIQETQERAIRQATDLIYIEDQYFRVPLLLPALEAALAASPELHVVVVTKPVSPLDGAKQWTVEMDEALREAAGDRYLLLQLKSFDPEGLSDGSTGPLFQPMDVHTKLMVVDDLYLAVGSANKNNRGLLYEGELNAAVLDADFVRGVRQTLFANLTEDTEREWGAISGAAVLEALRMQADENAAREAAWLAGEEMDPPAGFVYPLEITPEYYIDVGPDAF